MFASPEGERQEQRRPSPGVSTEKLSALTGDLRNYGQQVCRQQQQRIAGELERFGNSIEATAQKLESQEDARLAEYARAASQKLSSAANYMREKEAGALLRDAQAIARRRPELVIGGMFAAGVALARFLKASGTANHTAALATPAAPTGSALASTSPSDDGEPYVPLAFQGHRAPGAASFESPITHRVEAAGGADSMNIDFRRDTRFMGQED